MSFLQCIILVLFSKSRWLWIWHQLWPIIDSFVSFRTTELIIYMAGKERSETYNSVCLPMKFNKPQTEEILVRCRLKRLWNTCLFWEWVSLLIIQVAPFRYFFSCCGRGNGQLLWYWMRLLSYVWDYNEGRDCIVGILLVSQPEERFPPF